MNHVGHYEVVGELARGGMGVVLHGRDPHLQRDVAIKLLLAATRADHRRRLLTEAQVLARLRHPNVVAIHGVGEQDGTPYLVMDLIRGETLEARLRRGGALPALEAARLAEKLAMALHTAHGQSILHRDVKPDNVLINEVGEPLLTDFGMAKALDASIGLSSTGQLIGTPGYWSPEQADGRRDRIGPRSDVFGLGATLYAMLTAHPPFTGGTWLEVAESMQRGPVPPSRAGAAVEPALERVVLKALAQRPEDRYETAEQLARALRSYVEERTKASSTRTARGRAATAPKTAPRARALAMWVPLAVTLLTGAAAVVFALRAANADAALARVEAERAAFAEAHRVVDVERVALREALDQSRSWQAAAEAARRAAEASRDQAERARAGQALEVERLREEVSALNAAAHEAPPDAEPDFGRDPRRWVERASELHREDARPVAIAHYTRALELDPEHIPALSGRGLCFQFMDLHELARRDLDRAIELGDQSPLTFYTRAGVRRKLGDAAGAAADLERALELNPEYGDALAMRGLWLFKQGRHDEAIAEVRRALTLLPPDDPVALVMQRSLEKMLKQRAARSE